MQSAEENALTMADTADRHALYQEAVQNSEFELEFMDDTFKKLTGRKPISMREDFCGTAISSVEWIKLRKANRAIGIDFDPEVLDWGKEHNVTQLNAEQQKRLTLIEADVRDVQTEKVDMIQAYNFSYWFFQEREVLLNYFKSVREALVDDGLLFLDVFGGSECYQTQKEKRKVEGFKYVWEQVEFNAITYELKCAIHFHFPDKSKMKNAFNYTWRVWGARELRDVLKDAGFSETIVYRQEFDDDNDEPLDEYIATDEADDFACWLGYIVCRP
ncbi:MAG: class I SAM-dependent methyltransferase [Gammaproteobacteria bacterium]|nr:class I SAM-dependent methyltransferase [Gammaproteobacteria bacterium]